MPIRFGDMCRKSTNEFSSDNVLTNPITVAIFIVIIMVLLAAFSFRMCDCDNKYKNVISFAIYGIIATTAILFIHNNAILKIYKNKLLDDDANTIFNANIPQPLARPGTPVVSTVGTTGMGEENSLVNLSLSGNEKVPNSLDQFMKDLE